MSAAAAPHLDSDVFSHLQDADTTLLKLDLSNSEHLTVEQWSGYCAALRSNAQVQRLDIAFSRDDRDVSLQMYRILSDMLMENRSIIALRLYGIASCFDDAAAELLAAALSRHLTLQELRLEYCKKLTTVGVTAICRALELCPAIQRVEFHLTPAVSDAMPAVTSLLRASGSLRKLDLNQSDLTAGAIELLVAAVEFSCLEELDLQGNPEDAICRAVASMLGKKTQLRKLSVRSCNIEAEGCTAIADSLHVNNTLTELALSCNPLKAGGVCALASMLYVNCSLKKLRLACSEIGPVDGAVLALAVERNHTLVEVELDFEQILVADQLKIAASVQRNKGPAQHASAS
jgi:hypothetical protein